MDGVLIYVNLALRNIVYKAYKSIPCVIELNIFYLFLFLFIFAAPLSNPMFLASFKHLDPKGCYCLEAKPKHFAQARLVAYLRHLPGSQTKGLWEMSWA